MQPATELVERRVSEKSAVSVFKIEVVPQVEVLDTTIVRSRPPSIDSDIKTKI